MKYLLSVLAALVLALGLTGPAWADRSDVTRSQKEPGGQGGVPIHDECQPGDWMVGMLAEGAKDLNQIAVLCQHFQGTTAAGNTYQLTVRGRHAEENGVDSGPRCNSGDIVIGMKVEVSKAAVVHRFKLICSTPTGTATYSPAWSRVSGGAGDFSATAQCEAPNGQQSTAVGVTGGGGDLIHSLGLLCATNGSPAALVKVDAPPPAPPPPVAKAPAPVKPPIEVGNGKGATAGTHNAFARARAAAGHGGGANAAAGSAATDTTIYDQPEGNDVAYLQSGDPVTIVNCQDNWCQISKPVNGWVWGDDLNH